LQKDLAALWGIELAALWGIESEQLALELVLELEVASAMEWMLKSDQGSALQWVEVLESDEPSA